MNNSSWGKGVYGFLKSLIRPFGVLEFLNCNSKNTMTENTQMDSNSDEIKDLKILRLMATPSYIFACYLSAIDCSGLTNKGNSSNSGYCTCSQDVTNANYHVCPANQHFIPVSKCRQHPECNDPIYACLDLASLGSKLAERMPEYGEEYQEISKMAKKLPVQLLDQCSNTKDVNLLLDEDSGSKKYFKSFQSVQIGKAMKYPRLMLAIEMNHKEFVGHMYCQQTLKREWFCYLKWSGTSTLYKVIQMIFSLLTIPGLSHQIYR